MIVVLNVFIQTTTCLINCFFVDPNQELKIEGEQTEALEEDNLDLMLPTKKKKTKKVDFDEGETLEKDEGKNMSFPFC